MAVSISLSITQNSQNIEKNTSNVTVKVTAKWTYGSWNATGECTGSITIDGTTYSFSGLKFNTGETTSGSQVIMTKTVDVRHNADGTKTLACSASFNTFISSGTVKASGSKALSRIARASSFTVTNASPYMGETVTFNISPASSEFTHGLTLTWGGEVSVLMNSDNPSNYCNFAIPLSLAHDLPNSTSSGCIITCTTYHNGTVIGHKTLNMTINVPASVKPSCSFTLEDVTGVDDIYGSPVKGLSKIEISVKGTPAYSSPIDSYSVTANGVEYDTQKATTGVLRTAGASRVTATVTDKRGRSGSVSYDMNVQDYTAPAITALSAVRCNADGTRNKRGTHVKVTFSAAVSSMSGKNTAAYSLKYKKTSEGEDAYTTVNLTNLANNYAPANQTYIFAATPGNSYDIVLSAADRHNTSTKSTKAPTASAIFSWRGFRGSGTTEDGAGIGKVPEKPNTLQVGWVAEFESPLVQIGNSYSFQPDSFSGEKGYTCLAEITLKTLNVNAPIVFVINRRGAICPMTVYVRFANSSSTTDPDLGSIAYDGDNFGAFLVKKTTSVWRLYVDNTSGWSNPCLQAWYTTDSQNTRLSVSFPNEQIAGTEPSAIGTYYRATPAKMQSLLDYIFPVGSIYFSYSHVSPASMFGGTWTRIENSFLWATTSGGTIGQTGGESTHTLTADEMPSHRHTLRRPQWFNSDGDGTRSTLYSDTTIYGYTGGTTKTYETTTTFSGGIQAAGGGEAHNNMPPYIQVSVWRRTA